MPSETEAVAASPVDVEPERVDGRSRGTQEATQKLLEAATQVFGQKGFKAATVAEIARKCGVTSGSVYARWSNKSELFLATFEHVFEQRMVLLIKEFDLSAAEKLAMLGSNLLSSARNDTRDLWLEACVSARRDALLSGPIGGALSVEADDFAALVAEGKAAGQIDPALDTDAIVFFCQSIGVGSHAMLNALTDQRDRPATDEWNELMARMIGALEPRQGGESGTRD